MILFQITIYVGFASYYVSLLQTSKNHVIFACPLGRFENIKRKCLILVKSPIFSSIYKAQSITYLGGLSVCVYIQVFGDTYECTWTATHFRYFNAFY